MTHDHAKARNVVNEAQNTIEHTDRDQNSARGKRIPVQASELDHMNDTPDYKLRSIEIDDELTGRRIKKLVALNDAESQDIGEIPEDDNSGTGHRVNSTNEKLTATTDLLNKIRKTFMNFKARHEKTDNDGAMSERSDRSTASQRS